MKLSIIIPAYNERKTITYLLKRVLAANIYDVEKEIIVVDDCSTDGTYNLIKGDFRDKIILIQHEKNYGKGMGIRSGLKKATGDIILIQDADLEYNPDNYWSLIKPILDKKVKVVYGSRRLKEQKQYSGLSYFIGGIGLTWVTNFLYGTKLTDSATCYKVFHKSVLEEIKLECKRFEFCPEINAKLARLGYRIQEVPIDYFPRTNNEGKHIRWKDGVVALWTLIKWRFKKIE